MKTKTWVILFAALALVLAVASVLLLCLPSAKKQAEVTSDGRKILTLNLSKDGDYRVESDEGWNVLTVRDGKISVTAASCAGHDCMHRSPGNSGAPIVCLPNRLVVRFVGSEYDTFLQ